MRKTLRTVVGLTAVLVLPNCVGYSLAAERYGIGVSTERASANFDVWFGCREFRHSNYPPNVAVDVLHLVVEWPLDAVLSTFLAVNAIFDSDYDFRWGPVGALAGIALPGVSLMGSYFPPARMQGVELTEDEFDDLISRTREGDGLQAARDLASTYVDSRGLTIVRVELLELSPTEPGATRGLPSRSHD